MMYIQRKQKIADSPSTGYRYCLDALIATIAEMRLVSSLLLDKDERDLLDRRIVVAQNRAAELAGRLFEAHIAQPHEVARIEVRDSCNGATHSHSRSHSCYLCEIGAPHSHMVKS